MRNNFLITGFGRSGTKFLATHMNKSEKWEVKHEPRGIHCERLYKSFHPIDSEVVGHFDRDFYGEVNSILRFYALDLPVSKLGVIIRDPLEIFLSTMNRDKPPRFMAWSIHGAFAQFLRFPEEVPFIDFDNMVTRHSYLDKVFNWFGIDDVDINKIDLNEKINPSKNSKYQTYDDLTESMKNHYNFCNKDNQFEPWDNLMLKLNRRCKESFKWK